MQTVSGAVLSGGVRGVEAGGSGVERALLAPGTLAALRQAGSMS